MRAETFERLRAAVSTTPDLAPAVPREVITREFCEHFYGMIGTAEAYAAERIYKIPQNIARRVFLYNREDLDALAGPTAAVANKYATVAFTRYLEEVQLLMALLYVHQRKLITLRTLLGAQPRPEPVPVRETPRPERPAPVDDEQLSDFVS